MEIINQTASDYNEGKFTIVQEIKMEMDLEKTLGRLAEIKAQYNGIPAQIKQLQASMENLAKYYNEGLDTLIKAKLDLDLEDLELPERL